MGPVRTQKRARRQPSTIDNEVPLVGEEAETASLMQNESRAKDEERDEEECRWIYARALRTPF